MTTPPVAAYALASPPISPCPSWDALIDQLSHFLEQVEAEITSWKELDSDSTAIEALKAELELAIPEIEKNYDSPKAAYETWKAKIKEFIEGPGILYDLEPLPEIILE